MSKTWQLLFPAKKVAFSFMILFFAQRMSSCLLLVAMAAVPSQQKIHYFVSSFSTSPSCFKELHTSQAHLYSLCGNSCGRGNLLAYPVICCLVPGPTEKGKAVALRCFWTILQTWGPARRRAQFSSNLMLWLIPFSQKKFVKYSISSLSAWVSCSCISNGFPTECI